MRGACLLVNYAAFLVAATWLGWAKAVEAALSPAGQPTKSQIGICWIMLAVFVIGTLAVGFKSSRRREGED